jgi:hypothetical protein
MDGYSVEAFPKNAGSNRLLLSYLGMMGPALLFGSRREAFGHQHACLPSLNSDPQRERILCRGLVGRLVSSYQGMIDPLGQIE